MKRICAFALCCALVLSLCACGGQGGENTVGGTISYTMGDVYVTEKLLPEDTDGFYNYYEASEGNTLFIVEMDVTNVSGQLYRIWLLGEAVLTIGGTDYEASIAVKLDGQNDSFGNDNYEIRPNETHHVYYIFDIPAEVAQKSAVLTMTSNEETQTHNVKAQ